MWTLVCATLVCATLVCATLVCATLVCATLVKPGLLLTCGFATKAFLVAMRLLIRDFFSIAI